MFLREAGIDIATIALWLGHADIRSSRPYLHADLFRRNAEGLWVLHPSGPGSEVRLDSVGLVLTMEAIYEDAVTAAPTAPLAAELPPEPSAPTPQP